MSEYLFTITPINCGTLVGVDYGNLTLKRRLGERTSVPTVMWVIRGGGEIVIADTGPGDPDTVKQRLGHTIEREAAPVEILKGMGIEAKDVSLVVATHLHWDHAGDLDLFPNAEIYVQRAELHCAIAPPPIQNGIYEYSRRSRELPRWIHSLRRMRVLGGDWELMPGLRLVHLPGHTPGLMGVAANTSAGVYLVAGDAIPTYDNWSKGIPPGWYCDIQDCYRTLEKMHNITDQVLPGHDFRVFEHPTYPFTE